MKGVDFPGSHKVLGAPRGMEEQVHGLPVLFHKGDDGIPMTASVWQLTEAEAREMFITRRLILHVVGIGMPPVHLEVATVVNLMRMKMEEIKQTGGAESD